MKWEHDNAGKILEIGDKQKSRSECEAQAVFESDTARERSHYRPSKCSPPKSVDGDPESEGVRMRWVVTVAQVTSHTIVC